MNDRTLRIHEAAESLFLENGLRGTTMEAIARRAGVAKPTLYAKYPDKESVFRAVIADVIGRWKTIVVDALAADGRIEERIASALSGKYAAVSELLDGSPHARELMTDKILHAGAEFDELRDWLEARIGEVLAQAGREEPERKARLVVACADGLHEAMQSGNELSAQIAFVCERLLSEN